MPKTSIGLDIADSSIEVVELTDSGTGARVLNLGRMHLNAGVVNRGRIKNENELGSAIKLIFSGAKPSPITNNKIVFGMPESQVYTHVFHLGPHDKTDREDLVLEEAKANIPLEQDELIFSYKVLSSNKEGAKILLIATSRVVVKEWVDFFKKIKLDVKILDIESLAVFRGLFTSFPQKPICLVDIGAKTSNISIFNQAGLNYSFTSYIAGDNFTKTISEKFSIKEAEAEANKIKNGLVDQKILSVLSGSLKELEEDIKDALYFFKEQTGKDISEIILVGGSAKTKGLVDFLQSKFKQPVKIGASKFHEKPAPLAYIEATGLALRGLDKSWDKKDLFIPIPDKKDKTNGVSKKETKSLLASLKTKLKEMFRK